MEDIQRWTRSCEECQKRNSPPTAPAPQVPIVASSPFEKVAWDIMGPLPETKRGNKYILVLTDLFTNWVEAFPHQQKLLLVYCIMSSSVVLVSLNIFIVIRDETYVEKLCSLCGLLGIQRTNTTATTLKETAKQSISTEHLRV